MNSPNHSSPDLTALDAITGGALTAATSGERLTRVREWLNTEPALDVLQTVFKELSARDKGAAKPVKEKIDELRRAKTQDTLAEEWAEKARTLLAVVCIAEFNARLFCDGIGFVSRLKGACE